MFEIYHDKKVLITGHTGFKGSWLTSWLLKLGAKVCGLSDQIPTYPSMFELLKLQNKINHNICDVRDTEKLSQIIQKFKPDYVFHLAAQAIVSASYKDPLNTISTNVIGTANLLDVLRKWNEPCNVVIITSDKCYENVEWEWGYRETDRLGGKDIYSASKGAAEVIFHAYFESFFKRTNSQVKVATGRAGNVIGGGDWAIDRIVADCMRSWSSGDVVHIRNPKATRPWQHVLEPLSGYLTLAARLNDQYNLLGESFNFGPFTHKDKSVLQLISDLSREWGFSDNNTAYSVENENLFHEAGLLKLNCDKALFHLNWSPNLQYEECVKLVSKWYFAHYQKETDMFQFTNSQIEYYENLAKTRQLSWAK